MDNLTNTSRRPTRGHRRLLSTADENPLDGVANLFDATIVLSAALMIALLARPLIGGASLGRLAGAAQREPVAEQREKLERFRLSDQTVGGDGERLGIAYRLATGEVVCVTGEADGD